MSDLGRARVAVIVAFAVVFGFIVWTREHWTPEQKARWVYRLPLLAFPAVLLIAAVLDQLLSL